MSESKQCPGGGAALFEARQHHSGSLLAKCPRCGRVQEPGRGRRLRPHVKPGPTTRTKDAEMSGLWDVSAPFEYLRAQRTKAQPRS